MAEPGSPLRILHVCPRPSFSGLEAYALAMALGQKSLGHEITFVVLKDSPLAQKCAEAGIKTLPLTAGLMGRLQFQRAATVVLRETRGPEIIHLHSTQDLELMLLPLLLSLTAKKATGSGVNRRVILQTHIWISHSKRDPLHAISYQMVDEVWCSSGPARETLERFLPIPREKIRVVNYGREIEKITSSFVTREEARKRFELPSDAVVIGAVARIDKGKGTHELLEATLDVMEMRPELQLVWVGPPTADDPKAIAYAKSIEERVATLPPASRARVHFPGAVVDSYRWLKAFDLFALPTYKECFSLSLLEAQLAGLPVLGTRAGGTPEVVRENSTGWLFEPESVSSLREALLRALDDRSRWAKFGEAAAARVKSEFDFARLLPQTIEFYRELRSRA